MISIVGQFNVTFPTAYEDFASSFSWSNLVLDFSSSIESVASSINKERVLFVNNILTIALVGLLIFSIYFILSMYILYKFARDPQEHKVWQTLINSTFVGVSIRFGMVAYYQLAISSATEIIAEKWMLFVAVLILVSVQ